ncbi:MAG: CPBP family intramembrane metalloprotease, partial [Mailhella sp.]|nr:CPBP family intramembrane metalloprotease [Mailhella sp.]
MRKLLALNPSVAGLILLATFFWWLNFGLQICNFWLGMAVAASVLAGLCVRVGGNPFAEGRADAKTLVRGLLSAVALYIIFALGNALASLIFTFGPEQISNIYSIRQEGPSWLVALVLLFITSPAEEIFWRGFIQWHFMEKLGDVRGWLAASLVYAAIHISSGNIMLVLAALVAGLFWGWLYMKTRD